MPPSNSAPSGAEIQEIYQKLGDLVADGTLSAEVEQVYPLDQFKFQFVKARVRKPTSPKNGHRLF